MERGLGLEDGKMNEWVGMKNSLGVNGGKKRLVFPFRGQEFWKFIGFILSEVAYGKKWHTIWSETSIYFGEKPQTRSHRDVCG